MSVNPPQDESSYFIDPELAAETARLMYQDRLVTEAMGGVLAEQPAQLRFARVLDIGCGPGGWAIDFARRYQEASVIGIDTSETTVKYARAQAKVQLLDNVEFEVMDATKPLQFDDAEFDLINARFIFAFMSVAGWPRLISECVRIARPGGIIRLTEFDVYGITNSPAYEQITAWGSRAFKITGQSFSADGRNVCLTPMLGPLLRQAGCTNVRHMAHAIDFSAGMQAHQAMYQNTMMVFKLMQPFLLKTDMATQAELDRVYQQALVEMHEDSFCGMWSFLTIWGEAPR